MQHKEIEQSSIKIPKEDLKRMKEKEKRRQQRSQKRKSYSQSSWGGSKHSRFNYYADQTMDVGPSPEINENGS